MAANNNFEFDNLTAWLQSEYGKNALKQAEFEQFKGNKVMEPLVAKDLAHLKEELSSLVHAMEAKGWKLNIASVLDGSKFTFIPKNNTAAASIPVDSLPSFTVSKTENGYLLKDGMAAANIALTYLNGNGDIEAASALTLSLREINKEIGRIPRISESGQQSSNKQAYRIKKIMSDSFRNIAKGNADFQSTYTRQLVEDSIKGAPTSQRSAEGMKMANSQTRTSYMLQQMFKKYGNAYRKLNTGTSQETSEKNFIGEMEVLFAESLGMNSETEFMKLLSDRHGGLLKTVGRDQFKKLWNQYISYGTHTKKKEGSPEIFDITPIDAAFGSFAKSGRKPAQNANYLQKIKRGSHASGTNSFFTSTQYQHKINSISASQLKKGMVGQDLYTTVRADDKIIKQAVDLMIKETGANLKKGSKEYQELLSAAFFGIGKDGSIVSSKLASDFKGMGWEANLAETVALEDLLNYVEKKGIKKDDFQKEINNRSKKAKKEIGKFLGLDSLEQITKFNVENGQIGSIKTFQKLNTQGFKVLEGETGDTRSFARALPHNKKNNSFDLDALMGYIGVVQGYRREDMFVNGKDYKSGSKVHFAKMKEDLSDSNYRDYVTGYANYIVSSLKADQERQGKNEREALKEVGKILSRKGSPFEGLVTYDEGNETTPGYLKIDEQAVQRKVGVGTNQQNPMDFLNSIVQLGQSLQVTNNGKRMTIFDKSKQLFTSRINSDGETETVFNDVFPTMQGVEAFSTRPYTGMGRETTTHSRLSDKEIRSMENSLGLVDMVYGSQLQDPKSAISKARKAMSSNINELRNRLDEQLKINLGPLMNNAEAVANQTFTDDIQKQRDMLRSAKDYVVLDAFGDNGFITKYADEIEHFNRIGDDNHVDPKQYKIFARIQAEKENHYKKLVESYTKEGVKEDEAKKFLREQGINSPRDIKIALDYGNYSDGRAKTAIYRSANGTYEQNSGVAILSGMAESYLGGKGDERSFEALFDKDGKTSLPIQTEEGVKLNMNLLLALKRFNEGGYKANSELTLGAALHDFGQGVIKSVSHNGSYYDKYSKLDLGPSSGMVSLSALNETSSETFKELFKTKGLFQENDSSPNMIFSPQTLAEGLRNLSNSEIQSLYKETFDNKELGSNFNRSNIIREIVGAYNIDNKNYQGKTLPDVLINRFPTIKAMMDVLKSKAVVSGRLGTQGSVMIDRDLAQSMHGDFDGDIINMMLKFSQGDYEGAFDIYEDISKRAQDGQKSSRKESGDIMAKVEDIVKIFDPNERRKTALLANRGGQMAGPFGNLQIATSRALDDAGLGYGAIGTSKDAKTAQFLQLMAQTLYQKGINPKNAKSGSLQDNIQIAKAQAKMETMAQQRGTYENEDMFNSFLDAQEQLGIIKSGEVFEPELIANLGLNTLTKEQLKESNYLTIARRELKKLIDTYGKNNDKVKRIREDIRNLLDIHKGKTIGIQNISREFLSATLFDKDYGVNAALLRNGKGSFGEIIANTQDHLEARNRNLTGAFSLSGRKRVQGEDYSPTTLRGRIQRASKFISGHQTVTGIASEENPYYARGGSHQDVRELTKMANEIQELERKGNLTSKESETLEKSKKTLDFIRNKSETKNNLLSTIGGTLSHRLVEIVQNSDSFINDEQALELLKNEDLYKNSIHSLQLIFGDDGYNIGRDDKGNSRRGSAADFAEFAARKGGRISQFYDHLLDNETGFFRGKQARVLGAEIGLTGVGVKGDTAQAIYGKADSIVSYIDEQGRVHATIVDNKNEEHLGGSNLLQMGSYAQMMSLANEDIIARSQSNHGTLDFEAWLNTGADGNKIAQAWLEHITDDIENDFKHRDNQSVTKSQIRDKVMGVQRKLYEEILSQAGLVVDTMFIRAGGKGDVTATRFDYNNKDFKAITERLNSEDFETREKARGELQTLMQNQAVLKDVRTEFLGNNLNDAFMSSADTKQAFELARQKLLKKGQYEEEIRNLKERKQIEELGGTNPERVEKYDKEIAELKERIKEIDLGDAEKNVKGLVELVEFLTKAAQDLNVDGRLGADSKAATETFLAQYQTQGADNATNALTAGEKRVKKQRLWSHSNEELTKIAERKTYLDYIVNKGTNYSLEEKALAAEELAKIEAEQAQFEKIRDKTASSVKYTSGAKKGQFKKGVSDQIRLTETDPVFHEAYGIKKAEIEDQQRGINFYNKAYNVYREQYKNQEQIKQLERQMRFEPDRNKQKLYALEKQNLEEQGKLIADKMPDVKNFSGYTAEKDEQAKKKAALEHETFEQQQRQSELQEATGFLGMDSWVDQKMKRFAQGGVFFTAIRMIRKGLQELVQMAKQLDNSMTNLRIVTGLSGDEARNVVSDYADLAQQIGVTTTEVTNAATEWLRQGYSISETTDLITASMYLSKLGMIDSTTATKDLTSAMKGFKLEATEAMDIVDKLTALDVKAATTAGDIAEGLSQFANLASTNGVNIDQASAYVATIADVTQASGTTVGQAMKTIMSRYGNVKATAYNSLNLDSESGDTGDNLNDVEKVLARIGISVRNTNLQFKDFDEVLDELSNKWDTLDNVSKKAIANAFAGVRQQESFLTLMENYDNYKELLEVSENSSGTAATKYASYQESYAAAKNELTAALEGFVNSSELNKLLKDLVEAQKFLVKMLEKIYPWIPSIVKIFLNMRTLSGKSLISKLGTQLAKDFSTLKPYGQNLKESKIFNNKFFNKIKSHFNKAEKVSDKELKNKEEEVELSEKEAEQKEEVVNSAETETLENKESAEISKNAELQETAAGIEQVEQAQAEVADKQQVAQLGESEKQSKQTTAATGATGGTSGEAGGAGATGAAASKGSKAGGVIAGVSMAATTVASAISQFSTAATTHKYNGESVESSEQAQKMGSSAAAVVSMLPIVGDVMAPLVGEWIASAVDKERDEANARTESAEEIISALQSLDSNIDNLDVDNLGTSESREQVEELMKELYSEDGEDARQALAKYLGGEGALFSVLTDIQDNTSSSKDSLRQLKIAQLKAQRAQIGNKYASQMYAAKQNTNEAYSEYSDYSGWGWNSAGIVAGHTAAGALTGAAAGAVIGSVIPVIGTAVGAVIGAIGGAIVGLISGFRSADAEAEQRRKENEWNGKTISEKMTIITEQIQTAREEQKDGWEEVVENGEALLSALETQIALSNEMIAELNSLSLQEAVLEAYVGEGNSQKYISDMSVAQLEAYGIDAILESYLEALEENSPLIGISGLRNEDGSLSDYGYDYLYSKLRQQDDEEIVAFLSGKTRTLTETLKMKNQGKEQQRLLESFASALNITVDQLKEVQDLYGLLTYGEITASSSEIREKADALTSLSASILDSSGSLSEWMETLSSDFPELLAYTGKFTDLISAMGEKITQYANAEINSRYTEMMTNTSFYKTIVDEYFSDEAKALLEDSDLDLGSITNFSGLMDWVKQQTSPDGTVSQVGQIIQEAIIGAFKASEIEITSDALKETYNQLIEYRTSLLDDQINNLNEQKEALQDINSQREYENKLIEAKLKLENASKEKKRVYRAGVGWVYTEDQSAILEAQENLETVKNEKTVAELEAQITELEAQKNALSTIYDKQNAENLEKTYEALKEGFGIKDGSNGFLESIVSGINGISTLLADKAEEDMNAAITDKTEGTQLVQDAWNEVVSTAKGSGTNSTEYNKAIQNLYNTIDRTGASDYLTEDDVSSWATADTPGQTDGNVSIWDVLHGNYSEADLKATPRLGFLIEEDGTILKLYSDLGNNVTYDADVTDDLLTGMKNSAKESNTGYIFTKDGLIYGGKGNKNDARYHVGTDETFADYISRLSQLDALTSGFIMSSNNQVVYVQGGQAFKTEIDYGDNDSIINAQKDWEKEYLETGTYFAKESYAEGTLDSLGIGSALINELGTEAIITPQGTITALPAHSGVIPADITKNLWELGEVAPSLLRVMTEKILPDTLGAFAVSGNTDESINISTVEMNVNADATFDVDKFVEGIRTRVALTRNSRH